MFIRLKNDKVISLIGKGLDIIRLPDKDKLGITMHYALVIVHNTADPPPPAAHPSHGSDDAYWDKFEILTECETHDAGRVRLGQPLETLLDKICDLLQADCNFYDWRSEPTYISLAEVIKMSDEAERQDEEREPTNEDTNLVKGITVNASKC